MTRQKVLRAEYGDTILWVSFDNEKPWPIDLFRKGGLQAVKIHPPRALSEEEHAMLDDFLATKLADLVTIWPELFETRLNWPRPRTRE